MTGLTVSEQSKVEREVGALKESKNGTITRRVSKRTLYVCVAVAIGLIVTAGIVLGGVYLGHALTQASYKEARLQYTNENGEVKYEIVRVKENEIDFEAEKEFLLVFDYEKMMVVIKLNNGSGEICYITRLVSNDTGTFDDLRQQVTEANKTGATMNSSTKEVQFSVTSVMADVTMLGERAAAVCHDSVAVRKKRGFWKKFFKFVTIAVVITITF